MSNLTVACVLRTPLDLNHSSKQKSYSADDVLKLKKAVSNFLTIDHDFVCLTDQYDIPVDTISLIGDTPTWWAKLELFRPSLFNTPVLYIDLDMVICNELDSLVKGCYGSKFLMLKDPKEKTPGSGMMYWEGDYSYLWELYNSDPKKAQEVYRKKPKIGDQGFISDNVDYSFFTDTPNIKSDWFCYLKFSKTPHIDSKILICKGQSDKLHNDGYKNHQWVNKFWRNI
jgi:hypothetical protein